eukprot:2068911-Amphidinium_carterae.1
MASHFMHDYICDLIQRFRFSTIKLFTVVLGNEYSMTSEFSLDDVLELTRNFTVELKFIVQRKRQTAAVQYNLHSMQSAAIQDEELEEGDEDAPTACGLGGAPKKGGTKKKAVPPRPSNVRAAYQSDKRCPDRGNCQMVKKNGHPFMKGKCLNCGSTSHLKAACNRPMASGRNLEAEHAEQEGADQDEAAETADEPEQAEEDPNGPMLLV